VGDVRVPYDVAGQFLKGRLQGPYPERERFARDEGLRRGILERTLEIVRQGIDEVGIDILGHPTFTPLQALGDPEAAYPAEWQERLIALCVQADVAFEINESYGVPHRAFLVRAMRAGARFSVGSDTHFELAPLDRTAEMIAAADLPHERFLEGRRVRVRV
jgi:histidinol phosphatase-like PHP family hydrolase